MSFISDALKNLSNKKSDKEVMVPPGINGSEVNEDVLTSPVNTNEQSVSDMSLSNPSIISRGKAKRGKKAKAPKTPKTPKAPRAKGKGVPKVALIPIILIAVLGVGYFVAGDIVKDMIFPPKISNVPTQPQVAILDDDFYDDDFDEDEFFDDEFTGTEGVGDFEDDLTIETVPATSGVANVTPQESKPVIPITSGSVPPKSSTQPSKVESTAPKVSTPKATPKSTTTSKKVAVTPVIAPTDSSYVRPPTPPPAMSTSIIENNPYMFNNLTSQGNYALKAGNRVQALGHFEEALKYGESVDLSYNTALIYIEERQATKAVDVIIESKMQEEDLRELFELMLNNGYLVQTETALKKVLRRDNFGDLYYISGLLNEKKESYDTAGTEYRKAMIRSDFDPFITYAFARSQDILGNTEDAKNYYRVVLQNTGDISLRTASINRLDQLTYSEMSPAVSAKKSKSNDEKLKADRVDSNTRLINVEDYYDTAESEFNIQYDDY